MGVATGRNSPAKQAVKNVPTTIDLANGSIVAIESATVDQIMTYARISAHKSTPNGGAGNLARHCGAGGNRSTAIQAGRCRCGFCSGRTVAGLGGMAVDLLLALKVSFGCLNRDVSEENVLPSG